MAKVLGAFNMTSFFSNFGSGVFDITGIVYYLSIIGFCIFLTIQSIQRKRWGGDALMTAVVLAIVVVINLVVGQIPVKYTQFDLTDNQLYTITDQTKTFVKGLDSDVDVYLVAQSGQEDEQIRKCWNVMSLCPVISKCIRRIRWSIRLLQSSIQTVLCQTTV